jgi:AcrR family transcriptional regulator
LAKGLTSARGATAGLKRKAGVRLAPEVTRGHLLDATEQLMITEGYAAVTTRRVGAAVGLTAALVHYYFPTTDDLLLATYRRAGERRDVVVREALASERPLRALWDHFTNATYMALGVEFMALANHRKAIRKEMTERIEQFRDDLAAAFSPRLGKGIGRNTPALCAAMLMDGLARSYIQEKMLGISSGHRETKAFVEDLLEQIEGKASKRAKAKRG